MFYYEVVCCSCRQKFKLDEGSLKYKLFKERTNEVFRCEECESKIRMDAIKNFLSYLK